jgi:asparagine synthase (glutamine-hydrolysing)
MCGIAGVVDTRPEEVVLASAVRAMCNTLVHRGPDDEGVYVNGPVGLGMRRLSIIDLVSGQQPIHNEDETVWVVFNGEIYNFPQLRTELQATGHRFYTNSDTEVIVHLYEDLGADCVRRLRGMFAFAVYDQKRRRLLLARDRLGIKPLHYSFSQNRLLFGSEIKALLAVAPELAEISRESLLHFFYYGYIPDPFTAFRNIHKLPPGHLLELTDGKLSVREYWELPAFGVHEPTSEEECLEELEERLAEAVRIRLISDVPLGALLSGGVDSSTVVALMARSSSRPVKTFSIGFRKADFDETKYARVVAERFGTEHHHLIIDPNFAETLEELTYHLEEPFADSSMLPTYYVCRMARQHVTVALSGDGGDELFAGYDRYTVHLGRRSFDFVPAWAKQFYRELLFPILPSNTPGRRFVFNASLAPGDRYLDSISLLPASARERSLFSDEFLDFADRAPSPFQTFRNYLDHAPARDPLSRLQYLDSKTYLSGDILTKVDRMSMATSLEARVPFLDHPFVEWVTGLSPKWKLRFGRRKYILIRLAERLGIPAHVLHRRKQGFALPLVHWFRRELKPELLQMLLEPRTLQRGYFNRRKMITLLNEQMSGRRDRAQELWLLLIFELWHRNFLESSAERRQFAAFALSAITLDSSAVAPVRSTN